MVGNGEMAETIRVKKEEFNAKYLRGHASFAKDAEGKLLLYPDPCNKVVFESKKGIIEIPLDVIKDLKTMIKKKMKAKLILGLIGLAWKKTQKMLAIVFKDGRGNLQSPIFEIEEIEEVDSRLFNMQVEFLSKRCSYL